MDAYFMVAGRPCVLRTSYRSFVAVTSPRQYALPIRALTAAVAILFFQIGVSGEPQMSSISGRVIYEERLGLAKNSAIHVRLEDITDSASSPVIMAEQTVITDHNQVPITFSISFPRARVHASHRYAVSAEVEMGGRIWLRGRKELRRPPIHNFSNITVLVSPVS